MTPRYVLEVEVIGPTVQRELWTLICTRNSVPVSMGAIVYLLRAPSSVATCTPRPNSGMELHDAVELSEVYNFHLVLHCWLLAYEVYSGDEHWKEVL